MTYPGGKARCFQQIVNLIPAHSTYIETHLGNGSVLRNKLPANHNFGIDRDTRAINRFSGSFDARYHFIVGRAEDFLKEYSFKGDEFVYLDPPYWPSARHSNRRIYKFDYSEEDHANLLKQIKSIRCQVMISGYRNDFYETTLKDWASLTFTGTSRTGRREETVWYNYKPKELHDLRYLGKNFRERQSIKRRRLRWIDRFRREPKFVQQALLADLKSIFLQQES